METTLKLKNSSNMVEKTLVLITGANQGLGFYATQQLSATGKYHVLLGSRDLSKAEKAIQALTDDESMKANAKNVEPLQIDVASDESIQKAAETIEKKYGYLDILMLNAGVARSEGSTREQYKAIFDTNVFGAAMTVDTFLPLLKKSKVPGGKRIAFTSSGLASIKWALESEGQYSGANFPIYRSSKTALNMIVVHYAILLESEGFAVTASDPGYCATNLNGHRGLKDPREGAKVLIRGATAEKEIVHGQFLDENGSVPW